MQYILTQEELDKLKQTNLAYDLFEKEIEDLYLNIEQNIRNNFPRTTESNFRMHNVEIDNFFRWLYGEVNDRKLKFKTKEQEKP